MKEEGYIDVSRDDEQSSRPVRAEISAGDEISARWASEDGSLWSVRILTSALGALS